MGGLSMLVSTQEMGRGSASAGLAMRASVAIRARAFMGVLGKWAEWGVWRKAIAAPHDYALFASGCAGFWRGGGFAGVRPLLRGGGGGGGLLGLRIEAFGWLMAGERGGAG